MKVTVLGVKIDNVTMIEALDRIESFLTDGRKHQVVTVNSEFVVTAQKDASFRNILNKADLALPDGVGLLFASRLAWLTNPGICTKRSDDRRTILYKNVRLKERVSGVDLVEELCKKASERNHKVFLLGGKEGVGERAKRVLKGKFPKLTMVTFRGAQDVSRETPGEAEEVFRRINQFKPDFLFVAYGHPKQEKWIAENLDRLDVGVAMGVGGALDMIAGVKPRAPRWMRKVGLEWFWRLALEPARLKRVFTATVIFPLLVILNSFKFSTKMTHDRG